MLLPTARRSGIALFTSADTACVDAIMRARAGRHGEHRARPPNSRPLVSVETRERLQHAIALADQATPTGKATPAGVRSPADER